MKAIYLSIFLVLCLACASGVSSSATRASLVGPGPQNGSQQDLKIKGNKNSHIYHLPGCASYSLISAKNIVWFKTEAEAQAAGYRKAKNCP